jgi:hypothetical protein
MRPGHTSNAQHNQAYPAFGMTFMKIYYALPDIPLCFGKIGAHGADKHAVFNAEITYATWLRQCLKWFAHPIPFLSV